MFKNDFIYTTLLVVSILVIIGILTLIILLSVFKKQSLKIKLRRSLFITLGVYIVFAAGVVLTPITKQDTIEINDTIYEGKASEKDEYAVFSNGNKVLSRHGKLTRFFQDYYYMITFYNSNNTKGYQVFTNSNYDFIHFNADFGEGYKNKNGSYDKFYAKIAKPVGSCVYHTYFSFSYTDYLRLLK